MNPISKAVAYLKLFRAGFRLVKDPSKLDEVFDIADTLFEADKEKIQANLRAGAVPFLTLGRNEPGVAHFHRMLHAVLGTASDGASACT